MYSGGGGGGGGIQLFEICYVDNFLDAAQSLL